MQKILLACLGVLISSGVLFWRAQPDGLLHVYILDVGQGDAIFIRTPAGSNILVDGGPGQNVLPELKDLVPFFDRTLDYVLLTHTDRDHIEGLLPVLRRYPVERVLLTGAYGESSLWRGLLKIIREKNIPVTLADATSDIALADGTLIDILFPLHPQVGPRKSVNNLSLIAKVAYGRHTILLTGDAELPEENELLRIRADLDADILKVPHHGSKTSTSEAFLKTVSPVYSVISVGKGNPYGHPHASVLQRLAQYGTAILRTDRDGRIEFVFSKDALVAVNKLRPA